ncbi:MAG: LPS export ABC transporter periplasmic protein LptC [Candidatus Omnitrophica bacterium]|nr:LPS export ABC transporter periplasmic protein LptC [Candidatus Omnitrophota bacterium]
MIRRGFVAFLLLSVSYVALVKFQVLETIQKGPSPVVAKDTAEVSHKVYFFSFTKYTAAGAKEIEIEGDSADLLAKTVDLMNVVAKAYADQTPVTITADEGQYNKDKNLVHLSKNVVATTEDGTRLLTEKLEINPANRTLETDVRASVKKQSINIDGDGARGDSQLKKVKFKKNVRVVIKDTDGAVAEGAKGPTVITCDGALDIDYEKNIAYFNDNVVTVDDRGTLSADHMQVFYDKGQKRVAKIIATGNVVIENPDGNKTYSDNVIYLAEEGRVILGGDAEGVYLGGEAPADLQ